MSHDMTKPSKWVCAQRRLGSAWASAQSDQSLRCPLEESLGPELPIERTAKTMIRLGGCPGWSESSLGAHSFCWFCHVAAQLWGLFRVFRDEGYWSILFRDIGIFIILILGYEIFTYYFWDMGYRVTSLWMSRMLWLPGAPPPLLHFFCTIAFSLT